MNWYRRYNHTCLNPKFGLIARAVKEPRAFVLAVWDMVLEHASAAPERGHIKSLSAEEIAFTLDLEEAQVTAILREMCRRGMITPEKAVAAWDKYQPKREGPSTERVRAHRARQKDRDDDAGNAGNGGHANETATEHDETRGNTETPLEERRVDKSPPPNPIGLAPPQGDAKPKRRGRKSPEIPWPEGFALTDERRAMAQEIVEGVDADAEWQRFHGHAIENDRRCCGERGWGQAWRNWLLSPFPKVMATGCRLSVVGGGAGGGVYDDPNERRRRGIMRALAELEAEEANGSLDPISRMFRR